MPRFVVQHHVFPDGDEHWDLMLEVGDVLWTWSLPAPPDEPRRLPLSARQLAHHRAAFLDYEGPLRGHRGRVDIRDQGTYQWIVPGEATGSEVADVFEFCLDGERARGRYRLLRAPHDGTDLWQLRRLA